MMRRSFLLIAVAGVSLLACGGESAGGGQTAPSPPSPSVPAPSGTFTLRGAGYDGTVSYSQASGGLAFCRRQPNSLWVRLAAVAGNDGAAGPYLDLDLCNFTGTGAYARVHDVSVGLACTQGATWDVWWHDGSRTFVSRLDASPCDLALTRTGDALSGQFQCANLASFTGGTDRLDVLAGSFTCTLAP